MMNKTMKNFNFKEKIDNGVNTEGIFFSFEEHEILKNSIQNL
mgnify:CR=1 FL=1